MHQNYLNVGIESPVVNVMFVYSEERFWGKGELCCYSYTCQEQGWPRFCVNAYKQASLSCTHTPQAVSDGEFAVLVEVNACCLDVGT